MFKARHLVCVLLAVACYSQAALSQESVQKIKETEKGCQERWQSFVGTTRTFLPWTPQWRQENLKERFEQLSNERWAVYFSNPEERETKGAVLKHKEAYALDPEIFKKQRSRYPYPMSCGYNLACPSYNANIISLYGVQFLALEAPSEANVATFLQILDDYEVTELVRLVPVQENGHESCFPYWEGRTDIHPSDGRCALKVATREIHYFPTDCWDNHEGLEVDKLIALVHAVQITHNKAATMIAVHCHGGVGRTGTFIAAYLLAHEIDAQIAAGIATDHIQVSVDKMIWELSLQRLFAITHYPQYETLYQFVEAYLTSRERDSLI